MRSVVVGYGMDPGRSLADAQTLHGGFAEI